MIVIPPPPSELLPAWATEVFAVVGWLLAGVVFWLKRKK